MKKLITLLEKRYIKIIFILISGIVTGLTVCFPVLGALEWVSVVPGALVVFSLAKSEKHRLRSVYLYGLLYFMAYFVATWHWFYVMYPMEYTGMTPFAAATVLLAAILGLPLLQSSGFAFVFVLSVFIIRGKIAQKFKLIVPFVFAALWTVFEWLQTFFWFGVPWGRLAVGQTEILVTAQSASIFGCYIITFILVAINSLIAYILFTNESKRILSLTAASIFCFNIIIGAIIMVSDGKKDAKTIKVAAIQGNVSSTEKWDDVSWFDKTVESYGELTKKAAAEGAEIVVWAETVLPTHIEDFYMGQKFISDLAKECNITLLVGTISYGNEENGQYNAVIAVNPDGSIHDEEYYKQRLVPFGEYMPWRKLISALIPALAEVNMLSDDFNAGDDSYVISTDKAQIGAIICFDSIYEELPRQSAKNGAEFIAMATNDSWFFDSAAVSIHLNQAKLRAIETGRYLVRSANTGISAIVSPTGKILDIEPALKDGYCISEIELRTNTTPYTFMGNVFVYISVAFTVFLAASEPILKLKKGKNNA